MYYISICYILYIIIVLFIFLHIILISKSFYILNWLFTIFYPDIPTTIAYWSSYEENNDFIICLLILYLCTYVSVYYMYIYFLRGTNKIITCCSISIEWNKKKIIHNIIYMNFIVFCLFYFLFLSKIMDKDF